MLKNYKNYDEEVEKIYYLLDMNTAANEIGLKEAFSIVSSWNMHKRIREILGDNASIEIPMELFGSINRTYENTSWRLKRDIKLFIEFIFANFNDKNFYSVVDFEITNRVRFYLKVYSADIRKPYNENIIFESSQKRTVYKEMKTFLRKILKEELISEHVFKELQEDLDHRILPRIIELEQSVSKELKCEKGKLVLSALPSALLSCSHNNKGWRSCFSPDGDYCASPIIMANTGQVAIAYWVSDSNPFLSDRDAIADMPNMSWRMLLSFDEDGVALSNQYPVSNDTLFKAVIDNFLEPFGYEESRGYYETNAYNDDPDLFYTDKYDDHGFPIRVSISVQGKDSLGDLIDEGGSNLYSVFSSPYGECDSCCERCNRDEMFTVTDIEGFEMNVCEYCVEDYVADDITGALISGDHRYINISGEILQTIDFDYRDTYNVRLTGTQLYIDKNISKETLTESLFRYLKNPGREIDCHMFVNIVKRVYLLIDSKIIMDEVANEANLYELCTRAAALIRKED